MESCAVWLALLVALSLASACRDHAEQATRPAAFPADEDASPAAAPAALPVDEDASLASAAEAGQRAEAQRSPRARKAGRIACDADANDPGGCDYDTQACIHGECVTCPKGTAPFRTKCARKCTTDRDCPQGLVCNFLVMGLFLCEPPSPKRKCPPGEVWLRSDGECWKVCKSDSDCPDYQCCQSDPNAPGPICMGKCP